MGAGGKDGAWEGVGWEEKGSLSTGPPKRESAEATGAGRPWEGCEKASGGAPKPGEEGGTEG